MATDDSFPASVYAPAHLPAPVRRFVERSRAAIVALFAVAASDVLFVLAGLWYSSYLQTLPPEVVLDDTEFHASVLVYGLAALANLGVVVISAFCFLYWFYTAYKNLDHISVAPRAHGASWTVWGFVVPILSLYRPYSIMEEIRDGTEYRWDEQPDAFAGLSRPKAKVKLWWGLYLLKVLAESFTMRMSWRATTAGENLAAVQTEFLCCLLELVAVTPAVMVVHSITALQVPLLAKPSSRNSGFGDRVEPAVSLEGSASLPPPPEGLVEG
jgi:hypothetical protein